MAKGLWFCWYRLWYGLARRRGKATVRSYELSSTAAADLALGVEFGLGESYADNLLSFCGFLRSARQTAEQDDISAALTTSVCFSMIPNAHDGIRTFSRLHGLRADG